MRFFYINFCESSVELCETALPQKTKRSVVNINSPKIIVTKKRILFLIIKTSFRILIFVILF